MSRFTFLLMFDNLDSGESKVFGGFMNLIPSPLVFDPSFKTLPSYRIQRANIMIFHRYQDKWVFISYFSVSQKFTGRLV